MKSFTFIPVVIFVFITSIAFSQSDIRNARWGMTIDEVIKSEGSQPSKVDIDFFKRRELIYDLDIDSRVISCTYIFSNNRLEEVNLRVNWGHWQTDSNHDMQARLASIYKLVIDFLNKFNEPRFGWHFMNEQFSDKGKKFDECLGKDKYIKEYSLINAKKLESCVGLYADLRINQDLYIDYGAENDRTSGLMRFPLKNHEGKDTYIGWLIFKSKVRSSSF